MDLLTLSSALLLITTDSAAQTTEAAGMNDVIGIGGILATVIVGIVTCIVTWRMTLRSIKQQKITYRTQSFGIISTKIRTQQGALDELTITYGDQKLNNPYLLSLQIENTGNEAIVDPPICIRAKNSSVLIPGYFEDVPNGYEDKWILEHETDNSCKVVLKHINPKQIVKAYFFLDRSPEILFECPMPNVAIQRIGDTGMLEEINVIGTRKQKLQRATLALITLTLVLYTSQEFWAYLLASLLRYWNVPPLGIAAFVFSTLIISILLNIFGVNKLDRWIMQSKSRCRLIKGGLAICPLILLTLIIFDTTFMMEYAQIVIACIAILMISSLIHIVSVD